MPTNDDSPRVRTREPERAQGVIRFEMPDDIIPADHRARLLWRVLGTLDLAPFTAQSKAVEGRAGRAVASPRMLLCLWMYGISVGVGSAREIARLVLTDDPFRWIAGGCSVSHDVLSDFRIGHREALDKLFTEVVGTLLHRGLANLDVVAQDGTRVRASASAPSFRSESSLDECLEQARLHVKGVLAEADDPGASRAEHAARLAAARDYEHRVQAAITTVRELRAQGKEAPRASTTDTDARVTKMPDGGFRPGYNVQLSVAGAAHGGPRTIVGVRLTNVGSDMGSIVPMLDQIEARTGQRPGAILADANHARHACIEEATRRGVVPIIAVPHRETSSTKPVCAEVAAWRDRMETEQAKQLYKQRPALCELVNAHLKLHYGLGQVLVRGLPKVTCVVLLAALTSNILQHIKDLLA